MKAKAILLIRKSADTQELEEQKLQLTQYAISTSHYEQKNLIFIEHAESAIKLSIDERRGIIEMKNYIEKDNSINAVFVWELSRLVRNQTDGHLLKDYFFKKKIQFYCVTPEFKLFNDDISSPHEIGDLTFSLFLQFAENEMRTKKARFHRSKIRNARTGKFSGGFLKFGYRFNENGYYIENKEEAELIRYIFNRYDKEDISIFKLTKELLERGKIKTQNIVRNILISEEYTGQYTGEFATDRIKEKNKKLNRSYPQIISREQFLRCKEKAKNNNKKADKTNEIYFAHNLIKCVECGSKYIGMKSSVHYLCYGRYGKEARFNKDQACKKSPQININILDTILWRACRGLELSYRTQNLKNYKNELAEKIDLNNEKISSFREKIADEKTELERANNLHIKGRYSEEKLDEKYKVSEKIIGEYNNKISSLLSENQFFSESIAELSKSISVKEIKKINDDLYDENDLLEKQKIIKRHVNFINIIDDVPNHTRIIKIYFYVNKNPWVYKVHYKKKPQLIEEASGGFFAREPYHFSKVGYDIVKRFKRTKDKTITLNKPE